jgi:monothiol glutaredoxin
VTERIKDDITSNDVVLYMKGTPVFPMCGFSAGVVQVLNGIDVKFQAYNVLEDPSIREGIKAFLELADHPPALRQGRVRRRLRHRSRDGRERRAAGDAADPRRRR